ncbi:endo-1,4-beta-glucanase [Microsporum canis]|uniref:Negative regulator of the PHO system n=1 Tax=Arthroderma otae (strain ATCC MYA-4605 / CBS 113480) TaxID=554155 RepID=C5FTR3_ARTOC|nr:negative regulator of the PHO system [Microsporum canis CBS 113480]EEQ33266.1 negative regulator of the PHO system [Microsporum canis CBS 113480]
MAPLRLRVEGNVFRDSHDREVILRGINLDATAKYPRIPDIPSHEVNGFYDGDDVSFINRPFTLEDSHAHFSRLKKWGYNHIRYVFTWEAIEHAGPGRYDEDWITFTIELLRIAGSYGFYVYMDPHQDVWSRFSGGSGAPIWTLYAAGLDPRNFHDTQAALVQNTYPDPAAFPKMIWSTNYTRLVCQTMFTLFWAGKDFAPKAIIDGMNIQDYLQDHFIAACKRLATRIHEAGDLEDDVVIGWENINEPHRGMIGIPDISLIPADQQLQLGTSPTAFQGMMTGSGYPCEVTQWEFGTFGPTQTGRTLVDPEGKSVWLKADRADLYGWKRDPQWKLGECVWAQHGVWDPTTLTVLRSGHFGSHPRTGVALDYEGFINTYFLEHYRKYRDALRSVHKETIMFCQPPVLEIPPTIKGTVDDDPNMVHAVHFYDGLTLMSKHWNRYYNVDVVGILRGKYWIPAFGLKIGETAIRNSFRDQLHYLREESYKNMGNHPLLLTETGIPYDMDDKHAYKTGDYSSQISAMDANHFGIEGSGGNGYSLWTYASENSHEWGDNWNGEDLSIYSPDDLELPIAKSLDTGMTTLDPSSPSFSQSRASLQTIRVEPDNLKAALPTASITTESQQKEGGKHRGFRAVEAFVRPGPEAVHGHVMSYGFDLHNCIFTLSLTADSSTASDAPTLIHLPELHFPKDKSEVTVSGGKWEIFSQEFKHGTVQFLRWWHAEGDQNIKIHGVKRELSVVINPPDEEGYIEQCKQHSCILM